MKKILLLALVMPTMAFSQVLFTAPMEVLCGDTKIILKTLTEEYEEKPEFVGTDKDNKMYSLWTNSKEKTFTMVVTSGRGNVSCILGVGDIPEKS